MEELYVTESGARKWQQNTRPVSITISVRNEMLSIVSAEMYDYVIYANSMIVCLKPESSLFYHVIKLIISNVRTTFFHFLKVTDCTFLIDVLFLVHIPVFYDYIIYVLL